jgi:hypothetical protein
MATHHWVYVQETGDSTREPTILRSSGRIVVNREGGLTNFGRYIVTFPSTMAVDACVGSLANSVGFITVIPGISGALRPNQVRVLTMNPDNSAGARSFCLAAFSNA